MNAGLLYALLPALLSPIFRGLAGLLGFDWPGIAPPLAALLRSLPALALFWGWDREDLKSPAVLPFYGAYAGAVLDEQGFWGAGMGLGLGLLLLPFLRTPKKLRFLASLFFAALATFLATLGLWVFGVPTGWVLPLVLLLSSFLDPNLARPRLG